MGIPNSYRWIAVGNLIVRKHANASPAAPLAALKEFVDVAESRSNEDTRYRIYAEKSKIMWFSNFRDHDDFHVFLAEVSDKNTSGVSFFDHDERKSRDVHKKETEGGHFTSHILVSKEKRDGGHLVLMERLPGLYLGSLNNHFSWLSADDNLMKEYVDEAFRPKKARPVVEVQGYQSSTIREALKTGVLQDVEFIQPVESRDDGLEEVAVIKEMVHQAKWIIRQKVDEAEAQSVFDQMKAYFNGAFRKGDNDAQMFVRIKTGAGQITRTEVSETDGSFLEQAFVHNELITGFEPPLAQKHDGLRQDVVEKMMKIAAATIEGKLGADG